MLIPALLLMTPLVEQAALKPLTEEDLSVYPDAVGMPLDVQHFIIDYDDCQHWLGEEPYDGERRREINQAVAAVCPGVDARRAQLVKRYRANARVLARLRTYERLGQ